MLREAMPEPISEPLAERLPILSAKQVKTAIKCEYLYYLEYVSKQKPPDRSVAMEKGLEVHEQVTKPLMDPEASPSQAMELAQKDQVLSAVYRYLPQGEKPVVETRYYFHMGTHYRVVIPDFLYSDAIYDLKTTSSPWALRGLYSDDVIQLHYYYDVFQGRTPYVIKLLLPDPEAGREGFSSALFRVNISAHLLSVIRRTEYRILDLMEGSRPRPSPGKYCRYCGFRSVCPFSSYKPEDGGKI